jgi:hypothetical protein
VLYNPPIALSTPDPAISQSFSASDAPLSPITFGNGGVSDAYLLDSVPPSCTLSEQRSAYMRVGAAWYRHDRRLELTNCTGTCELKGRAIHPYTLTSESFQGIDKTLGTSRRALKRRSCLPPPLTDPRSPHDCRRGGAERAGERPPLQQLAHQRGGLLDLHALHSLARRRQDDGVDDDRPRLHRPAPSALRLRPLADPRRRRDGAEKGGGVRSLCLVLCVQLPRSLGLSRWLPLSSPPSPRLAFLTSHD